MKSGKFAWVPDPDIVSLAIFHSETGLSSIVSQHIKVVVAAVVVLVVVAVFFWLLLIFVSFIVVVAPVTEDIAGPAVAVVVVIIVGPRKLQSMVKIGSVMA